MFIIIDNMEQEGVITWDEAKQMQDSGLVTIASHSMNHPEFTNLDTETAVSNVNESYNKIEEKCFIVQNCLSFIYSIFRTQRTRIN